MKGRLEIQHGDWVSFPHETDGRLVIGRVAHILTDFEGTRYESRIYTDAGTTLERKVLEVRRESVSLLMEPEESAGQ